MQSASDITTTALRWCLGSSFPQFRKWRSGKPFFSGDNDEFFKMGEPYIVWDADKLLNAIASKPAEITDVFLDFTDIHGGTKKSKVCNVAFTNVGAKATKFHDFHFSKCTFNDCLFLGVEFINCEFHQCTFSSTNTHKIRFSRTYIHPNSFENCVSRRVKYANVGVHLFQELCRNANDTYQIDHLEFAEFQFRRWLGREFIQQLLDHRLSLRAFLPLWAENQIRGWIAGYGLKPFRTLWNTLLLLLIISTANWLFWDTFKMSGIEKFTSVPTWLLPAYFSVITLTTVGYGDLTPTTTAGVVAASSEALLGLLWFSFCASVIIKKVLR